MKCKQIKDAYPPILSPYIITNGMESTNNGTLCSFIEKEIKKSRFGVQKGRRRSEMRRESGIQHESGVKVRDDLR